MLTTSTQIMAPKSGKPFKALMTSGVIETEAELEVACNALGMGAILPADEDDPARFYYSHVHPLGSELAHVALKVQIGDWVSWSFHIPVTSDELAGRESDTNR